MKLKLGHDMAKYVVNRRPLKKRPEFFIFFYFATIPV